MMMIILEQQARSNVEGIRAKKEPVAVVRGLNPFMNEALFFFTRTACVFMRRCST